MEIPVGRMQNGVRKGVLMVLLVMLSTHSFAQIQTDVPALKDVYAHDFYIGCLLSYPHIGFSTDPVVPGQSSVVDTNGGYLIKYHMNSMGRQRFGVWCSSYPGRKRLRKRSPGSEVQW
jgi:hypothetical protein